MRMDNALSSFVGEEIEGDVTWSATLAARNGCIYGIHYEARQVAKFNPIDKSFTHIGPDFGDDEGRWYEGVMTGNGIIYYSPCDIERGILKIDTNTDNVTELDRNHLPERGNYMWESCALALDGCIYFMPCNARRILKLDPNNNDAMSSVGDDLGDEDDKYYGTLVGIDGYVYGIPNGTGRIVKYDPINDTTTFVGDDVYLSSGGGCVVGRDGCIYTLDNQTTGSLYRLLVLKIDTTNNGYCFVGNSLYFNNMYWGGSGSVILGIDGCIYWPPDRANRILKYDPHTNQTLLVGDDYGNRDNKWRVGALASDGVIYCFPSAANRILSIDPLNELSMAVKNKIEEHPQEFGFLFQTTREIYDEEEGSPLPFRTNFDHAVIKFGQEKVMEVLEKHMQPVHDFCKGSNLCPFMIVASSKESTVSAIHHFLRRDLSWLACINTWASTKSKGAKQSSSQPRGHNHFSGQGKVYGITQKGLPCESCRNQGRFCYQHKTQEGRRGHTM